MALRQYQGRARWLLKALSIGTMLYAILYTFDIFPYFGVIMMPITYQGLVVGLFLTLTFFLLPAGGKSQSKPAWYDYLLALVSLAGGVYVFLFARQRVIGSSFASPIELVLAIGLVVAILEATRRTVGWVLAITIGVFLLYAPFANYLPGVLQGPSYSLSRIAGYLYLFHGGIFGSVIQAITTVVLAYLVFAQLLYRSGAGKFFIDIALSLFGRFRGGPAKGAVFASALFGTISGSPTSNVATTGILTIPLMKEAGYRSEFAAGVEAAAAVGGGIMPPVMGATAFVMANFLEISYSEVCLMALWPAILYYASILIQVDFEAAKKGLASIPPEKLPSIRRTLARGWHYGIPIVVLLYFLLIQRLEPIPSVLYASLAMVAVSFFRKESRLGLRTILNCLDETSKSLLIIVAVGAGAGVLVGCIGLTGLGIRLSQILVAISGGNVIVLVMLAAILGILLGTGLIQMTVYILLAVLVAPALVSVGLDREAVHMFILFTGVIAFLTPPTCTPVFVTATIANAKPMATAWEAMHLAIVAYLVPFMFIFNPSLILKGPLTDIVLSVSISAVAILALAGAVEGFLLRKTSRMERVLLTVGGVLMMIPNWPSNVSGVVVLALVAIWQWRSIKRVKSL